MVTEIENSTFGNDFKRYFSPPKKRKKARKEKCILSFPLVFFLSRQKDSPNKLFFYNATKLNH
ncbi:hypothetical protein NBRC111894_2319 [Sporolactobacillus inulinus]|uniref:Uncharacterized protein n=1 Tax=Sporolactobacillus inulinus TaxID=2078 RepID=A0A4Y1ZCJ1_9BACL|nr:hypothetical protein NBRC111894_2319 [Sporolactobacillus inulinus]